MSSAPSPADAPPASAATATAVDHSPPDAARVPPAAAAAVAAAALASLPAPARPREASWAAAAAARYLVASRSKPDAAAAALAATLAWRAGLPDVPGCAACARDATSHCIICAGALRDGRPVIYLSPPRARNLEVGPCTEHLLSELEAAFAADARGTAQAVWLADMRGFSLLQDPRTGIAYARLLSSHYPERLGRLVVATPPTVFGLFLRALMPFIDARTASKITMLHAPADVAAWVDTATWGPGEPGGDGGAVRAWLRGAIEMDPAPGNLPPSLPPSAPAPTALR